MNRMERFFDTLDTLLDSGEEWESEIQSEVRTFTPDKLTDFLQEAASACDMLAGIVRNVLMDAVVSPKTAGTGAGGRAGS